MRLALKFQIFGEAYNLLASLKTVFSLSCETAFNFAPLKLSVASYFSQASFDSKRSTFTKWRHESDESENGLFVKVGCFCSAINSKFSMLRKTCSLERVASNSSSTFLLSKLQLQLLCLFLLHFRSSFKAKHNFQFVFSLGSFYLFSARFSTV